MKRIILFSLALLFNVTLNGADNRGFKTICDLFSTNKNWHEHVKNVCKKCDIKALDEEGNTPIASVLKSSDMTKEQKQLLLDCMTRCGGCEVTEQDRRIAKMFFLTCILPK